MEPLHPSADYGARLETLRSSAKWLLTASAGTGVVLVAGVQLGGLGRLSLGSWHLYVAVAGAVMGLSAVGYMIALASSMMTQEWLTLASFVDAAAGLDDDQMKSERSRGGVLGMVEDKVSASRHELYGHVAPSLEDLHRRLHTTHDEIWRLLEMGQSTEHLAARSLELRYAAQCVVQCANYYFAFYLFRKMRARLGWAGLAVGVGAILFAYFSSTPA